MDFVKFKIRKIRGSFLPRGSIGFLFKQSNKHFSDKCTVRGVIMIFAIILYVKSNGFDIVKVTSHPEQIPVKN